MQLFSRDIMTISESWINTFKKKLYSRLLSCKRHSSSTSIANTFMPSGCPQDLMLNLSDCNLMFTRPNVVTTRVAARCPSNRELDSLPWRARFRENYHAQCILLQNEISRLAETGHGRDFRKCKHLSFIVMTVAIVCFFFSIGAIKSDVLRIFIDNF